MVTIYEADTSIDAHLLRGLLEQRGIPVHIVGEALEGGVGELPAGGLVAVLVPDHCEAAALEVVDAFEANLGEPVPYDDVLDPAYAPAHEPDGEPDYESDREAVVWRLGEPTAAYDRDPNVSDWVMLLAFLAGMAALSMLGGA